MKKIFLLTLAAFVGVSTFAYGQGGRKSSTNRTKSAQSVRSSNARSIAKNPTITTITGLYNDEELEMPSWIVKEFSDINKRLKEVLPPHAYIEILKGELFLFGDYKTKAEYNARPERTYANIELNELLTIEGAKKKLHDILADPENERVFDYPQFLPNAHKGIFFRENFRYIGRTYGEVKFSDEWNIISCQKGRGNSVVEWRFWDSKTGYLKERFTSPTPPQTEQNYIVGRRIPNEQPIYVFFSDPQRYSIRQHWFKGLGKYLISPSKRLIQSYYGTIADARKPNLLIKHKAGSLYRACAPLPQFGIEAAGSPWYTSQPVYTSFFHLVNQMNEEGVRIKTEDEGLVWRGNMKRQDVTLDLNHLSISYTSKETEDKEKQQELHQTILESMTPAPVLLGVGSSDVYQLNNIITDHINDRYNLFICYHEKSENGGVLPGCLLGFMTPKHEVYLFPTTYIRRVGEASSYAREGVKSSDRVEIQAKGQLKKYDECLCNVESVEGLKTGVNIDANYVYTYGAPRVRVMKVIPNEDETAAEIQMGLDLGNNEERMYLIHVNLKDYSYEVIKEWKYTPRTISPVWLAEKRWFLKPESDFQYSIIKLNNKQENIKLADLYIVSSSEYAIVLPNGLYTGSPGCEKLLAYGDSAMTVGMNVLSKWRNRPGEVLEALGGNLDDIRALKETTKRWLKKQGLDIENMPEEPKLKDLPIAYFPDVKLFYEEDVGRFKVKLTATKHDITRLEVRADGVLIPQSWDDTLHVPAGQEIEVEVEIPLVNSCNWIEVTPIDCTNIAGDTKNTRILFKGQASSKLYIVTLGVSDYDDKSLNLQYAAKDAKDIAQTLERRCFGEKQILTLTDKEVYCKDILVRIKDFLSSADINDRVIFYIAGHGVLDDELNYYYAPAGFDVERIHETGISVDELTRCLQSTKARYRLLLMDTCHSGIMGEEGEDKLAQANVKLPNGVRAVQNRGMKVIGTNQTLTNTQKKRYIEEKFSSARERGINVIAASAGAEYALESDQWNNGVFTACVMKSFNEAYDEDKDGSLTVQEIGKYIVREVQKQTAGLQSPSLSLEGFSDFLLGDASSFTTLNSYIHKKQWDIVKDIISRSPAAYEGNEAANIVLMALHNHAPAELIVDLIKHGQSEAQDYSVFLYRLLNGDHGHKDSHDYCNFYDKDKRSILQALLSTPLNWKNFVLYRLYSDQDLDIIKTLVNQGVAMASIYDPFGPNRSMEQFEFLLSSGADPNTGVRFPSGLGNHLHNIGFETPPRDINQVAQMRQSFNAIPQELFNFYGQIYAEDYKNEAIRNNQSIDRKRATETIEMQVRNYFELSALHRLAITYAFNPSDDILKKMRILLEWGADPNSTDGLNGITPLHALFRAKKGVSPDILPAVKLLLEFGADITLTDYRNRLPLDSNAHEYPLLQNLANEAKNIQTSKGIYASKQEYSAFSHEPDLGSIKKCYSMYGNSMLTIPDISLTSSKKYDNDYSTVYSHSKRALLNLLEAIQNGADVNTVLSGTGGNTALHYACALAPVKGTWIIIRWLINHGADVNAVNDAGFTPLDMTCIKTSSPIKWWTGTHDKSIDYFEIDQRIKNLLITRGARRSGKNVDIHYFEK